MVGYYAIFPGTNYDIKKVPVWDLTDKHHDMSLRFEAICRCPHYKTNFSPQFPKPNIANIYPGLFAKINN
jgi:hypothetical protein